MKKEHVVKIFIKAEEGDISRTKKYKGTKLSIVRELLADGVFFENDWYPPHEIDCALFIPET